LDFLQFGQNQRGQNWWLLKWFLVATVVVLVAKEQAELRFMVELVVVVVDIAARL
jgi:hypothetical protein